MIREARQLGVYIERGREWLRSVGELDKGGSGGMTPAIGKGSPDRERGLPGFDRGRDDRGRGGHER